MFRVGISPFYTRLFLPFYIYIYIFILYIYIYMNIYMYVYIYEQKPFKAILLDQLETFFILSIFRSDPPDVFLGKSVLKICSKFTREHPYRSVISVKLQSNFVKIPLSLAWVNLPHIFRTLFLKNTSGRLLLNLLRFVSNQH